MLVVAIGASGFFYANYRYDQIKKVHAKHLVAQAAPGKPFNILLVGSDSRKFVGTTPKKEQEFGTPTTQLGGQRSDVTMVARFIPATKQIWILSIPRDLWVDIPGDELRIGDKPDQRRLQHRAGPAHPDHRERSRHPHQPLRLGHFTGFQGMVNALGGVTMDFSDPVKDAYSGLDVTQTGCQVVDGATALELVRARHLYYQVTGEWEYDGLSDFSRIQRQDAFFRAVLHKLDSVKLDPFTINSFLGRRRQEPDHRRQRSARATSSPWPRTSTACRRPTCTPRRCPPTAFATTGGADVLGEAEPYGQQT